MRRRAKNRLWTRILFLLLFGAGAVSMPRGVRAEVIQLEPETPPTPQSGDPDFPDTAGKGQKPGASRGAQRLTGPREALSVRRDRLAVWMWNFRTAFAATYRSFLRF